MNSTAPMQSSPRLERLLRFLDGDPANLALLADAAGAAFDENALDAAAALLERHAALAPLPPGLQNLNGLVAIRQQRFDDAAAIFGALRQAGADDPALRFNLAWSKAMTGAHREACPELHNFHVFGDE